MAYTFIVSARSTRNWSYCVTRADKVWSIRQRCIKANAGVLWNDHGDVLKRVVRQDESVPTKIGPPDVLQAWKWVYNKRGDKDDGDEDSANVFDGMATQIEALWDSAANDLTAQSDKCIDLLADQLLENIPRAKGPRT